MPGISLLATDNLAAQAARRTAGPLDRGLRTPGKPTA